MLNMKLQSCTLKRQKDKGYAWVVLLMSFLSHMAHQGFSSSVVGNLTVAQQSHFGIDLQASSLICSVHTGLMFMLGLLGSILLKKLGSRFTQTLAGILMVLGVGLSYFSTQVWHVYILFSIMAAAGLSFGYVASAEILSQHFVKRKHLAFSLAVTGNFIGKSIWPMGSQFLLDKYGYSKAMLFMSFPHFIHIIAGVFYISPDDQEDRTEDQKIDSESDVSDDRSSSDDSSIGEESADQCKNGGEDEGQTIEEKKQNKEVEIKYSSKANILEDRDIKEKQSISLKDTFKLLFRDIKIWALLINAMLWNATNTVFYVLINDYMLKKTDMNGDEVAFGVTISGLARLAASIVVAATSCLKYDRLLLHMAAITGYSLVTIFIIFADNQMTYYACVALWGVCQGASIANLVSTVNSFCEQHLLGVLFGVELFFEAFGSMALTPLATFIGVLTEEKYALVFAGCLGMLGSIILVPVAIRNHLLNRRGH